MSCCNDSGTSIVTGQVIEDSACTILARVYGNAGTAITQSALASITCKVFDVDSSTPDTAVAAPTVTIASSVFDTLQTDARWTQDTTGFNFAHVLAASIFTTGDHYYRAEYLFTPSSGEVFRLVANIYCVPIRGS